MKPINIEKFTITGLSMRTTNENGQSSTDIPELWNTFMSEKISADIRAKEDDTIYCIYTDYEKDYTKPYTVILGHRVKEDSVSIKRLVHRTFDGGPYLDFLVKGKLSDGIVFSEWSKIWNSTIQRAYTADFEVYTKKSFDVDFAEIHIFLSIQK